MAVRAPLWSTRKNERGKNEESANTSWTNSSPRGFESKMEISSGGLPVAVARSLSLSLASTLNRHEFLGASAALALL